MPKLQEMYLDTLSKKRREELFEALAREVEALQRQATLLRRVVKLVTPLAGSASLSRSLAALSCGLIVNPSGAWNRT